MIASLQPYSGVYPSQLTITIVTPDHLVTPVRENTAARWSGSIMIEINGEINNLHCIVLHNHISQMIIRYWLSVAKMPAII